MAIVATAGTTESRASPYGVGPTMAFVNPFYFYLWDSEWGSSLLEDQCLCPLSHLALAEWPRVGPAAVARAGIASEALDNGFRSGADPTVAKGLGPPGSWGGASFFVRRLPSPFTGLTCDPVTSTNGLSVSLKSPTPGYSTDRQRAGGGLKE